MTNNVINNGALSLFLAYDDQLTRKNHEFISGPNPDFTLGEFPVIVQKRPAESSHMMRTHGRWSRSAPERAAPQGFP